jgi:hypothetical protein
MSKIKNLPELATIADDDLLYIVDDSAGANAGRKVKAIKLHDYVQMTDAEVKTKYEANADTNAFTDAEQAKLASVKVNGDLFVSVSTGLIASYTAGIVRFDGVVTSLVAGNIALTPNITDGRVYVDTDGVVKQTGSGVQSPTYTIPLAMFSTGPSSITSLLDRRVDSCQNIVRGLSGDISAMGANNVAAQGSTKNLADAGHVHTIVTAAPVTQTPDQTAAVGTSNALARADHVHNIPAALVVDTGTANAKGSAASFALSDHTHKTVVANDIATATADDTTASTTDVLIVGMTLTPAAGTYLALFSSSFLNSANGASRLFISIWSAAAQVAHSERNIGIAGGSNVPGHTNAIVTVNGSQAIEARWRAVAGTNTCHQRSLTLIKLA